MTYDACIETIVFDRFLMHLIQQRSKHSSSMVHRSARRLCPRSFAGCCVEGFVVVVITNDPVFRVRVFLFVNLPFLEIPFVSYGVLLCSTLGSALYFLSIVHVVKY